MKVSTKTDERALSFLAAACYLVSLTVCGFATYAIAQLTAAASADAVRKLYLLPGIF